MPKTIYVPKWDEDFFLRVHALHCFPHPPFYGSVLREVESKILIGSRKKQSQEIGSQNKYFFREVVSRSNSFES